MTELQLLHVSASRAIDLKNQLIQDGLNMGTDFVWEYQPPRWDGFTNNQPSAFIVKFKEQGMATFYNLRWQ